MEPLEKRLGALIARMEEVGFADARADLPVIRVEGTWQGERLEFSYVVYGPVALEQFFQGAEQSVAKLICKRDHKRQTWGSLGFHARAFRPEELAPCAEVSCSQGIGSMPFLVGDVEFERNGEPGSTTWVRRQ